MSDHRFKDANLRPWAFSNKTMVVCPKCKNKAIVTSSFNPEKAELSCSFCHYYSNKPTYQNENKDSNYTKDYFFNCEIWLQASFRGEWFRAHNYEHLSYMEQYIRAGLRERNNREYFTLVEKLPKFIKSAKNREKLLKLIDKLKKK
jgi:hypothetical protein